MIAPQRERGHLNLVKRGHYNFALSHPAKVIDYPINQAQNFPVTEFSPSV